MSTRKTSRIFGRKPARCVCQDWQIKAWYELVHHTPGLSAEDIAERMGIDNSTLDDYATSWTNTSRHHVCAPWSRVLAATLASGNYVLINTLCQRVGLTTPKPRKPTGESTRGQLSQAVKHMGEALMEVGEAMKEEPVPPEEHRKIRYHFRRLRAVLDDFDATVSRIA